MTSAMDNTSISVDEEVQLNNGLKNGPGHVFLLVFLSVQGNDNDENDDD